MVCAVRVRDFKIFSRLYKKGSGAGSLPETAIEIPTIHRALFKAGPPGPNKSVKFTVKI